MTNLGFGKKFTAEFYIDGKKASADFFVDDFEKMIAGQDELRITLKRMTRGRVVKIKMASAATG